MNRVCLERFGPVEGIRLGFGPLGPPIMTVIVYRLGDTLIDCGQSHMAAALLNILEKRPPKRALLTHYHEDHSGNAAALADRFGTRILGHAKTAAKLAGGFPIRPYQHYIWGKSKPAAVDPLPKTVEIGEYRLRPIHTPGHSPDHVVYLEDEKGWLFSGDIYLGSRIKFFRADETFADQIASLKTLLAQDFDALFCAHSPVPEAGKKPLAEKLAFLEELYGRIGELRGRGFSQRAIARRLDPGLDRMARLITLGNVSFPNMVRAALKDLAA